MRSVNVGCGGKASEMGRRTIRFAEGMWRSAVGLPGVVGSSGRLGTEQERRPDAGWWGVGDWTSVAVAEDAVEEEIEASSKLEGWPYCAAGALKPRGRVCTARSKPETAESMPLRNVVVWAVVRVRIFEPAFRSISIAEGVPLRSGASENGPRPCHISQKTRCPSISTGL